MILAPAFLTRPIAHRALHGPGRPENSRAAVAAAVDHGYGIEIDVQLSRDGSAMVFHDDTLDRLTPETGAIRQRDAAALTRIPLKGSDETIPMLADLLDLVAGRVPLLIEVKDQDGALGPDVGALERAVAETVAGYDGPLAVMSFNPHAIAAMARLLPDVPRGLTTCSFAAGDWPLDSERRAQLATIPDYDRVGASFISHEHRDLSNPRLPELRRQGAGLLCWTIRSVEEEAVARQVADNVTFEGYLPSFSTS
ncbi:Glycerophosphoryl diester phosphodiesterase [Tranquillimonas rosea]|uniref:Glycerophosphoryl diester phosphodiesterase n=1 Tax=Tranquillimonas rosea TaxID=641238 RepID=A0A1H9W4W8_9RHOB|nr:glycerophosphodiester phosphodiesterase family protein [Tranquillimonas rosea]SES28727.1 Glycerophosphoryl diester phosphodiesterase [Tranquillimonas rosea]